MNLSILSRIVITLCASFLIMFACHSVRAQETRTAESGKQETGKSVEQAKPAETQAEPFKVEVAGGNLQFTVTGNWKSVQPQSRMLESELQIPKVGEDEQNGRLTIIGAGGSIEDNVVRWQQQFVQPDGSDTAEKTKTENRTIDGQKVRFVDITGTFMDAPGGPMSGQPKVERKGYRMLAAIVQTKANGNYFVKFYGPKATVEKNAEAFKAMIESLKVAQ